MARTKFSTKQMDYNKISQCKQCKLYKSRYNVVIGRGEIPAKVLFLGEAPGATEDIIGRPFIGKIGALLTKMIEDAKEECVQPFPSYFITNTILCRPVVYSAKYKTNINREPDVSEVLKCKRNILSIIRSVDPKIICFVGKEAEKYYYNDLRSIRKYKIKKIMHPAYLLRTGGLSSPYYGTNIRYLTEIIMEVS